MLEKQQTFKEFNVSDWKFKNIKTLYGYKIFYF